MQENNVDIKKHWHGIFDKKAADTKADHEASYVCEYSMIHRLQNCLELLSQHVAPGKHVLDSGFGPGTFMAEMRTRGYIVTGIDYSENMAARTRNNYTITTVAVSSVEVTPFRNASFDAIISMGIFQYLPEPEKTIAEFFRLTRDNGVVILNTMSSRCFFHTRKDPVILSDPRELAGKFKNGGFRWVETRPFFVYPKPFEFLDRFNNVLAKQPFADYVAHQFFLVARK